MNDVGVIFFSSCLIAAEGQMIMNSWQIILTLLVLFYYIYIQMSDEKMCSYSYVIFNSLKKKEAEEKKRNSIQQNNIRDVLFSF